MKIDARTLSALNAFEADLAFMAIFYFIDDLQTRADAGNEGCLIGALKEVEISSMMMQ